MLKNLAEITVNKNADWNNKIIKALEEKGFTIIENFNGLTEIKYIIAYENDATK